MNNNEEDRMNESKDNWDMSLISTKENLPTELKETIDRYYKSLESAFEYTDRNRYSMDWFYLFFGFPVIILFMFSVLPLIPFVFSNELPKRFGNSINISSFPIPLNSFLLWWMVLLLLTILMLMVYVHLDKKIMERKKNKEVLPNQLSFCYLYKAIKEIGAYIVNHRKIHLELAQKNLKNYISTSQILIDSNILKRFVDGDTREIHKIKVQCFNLINLLRKDIYGSK